MCGIVGYNGAQRALPLVTEGLQNLEYRGYDSAGVALSNGTLDVYKRSGEVSALLDALPESADQYRGIGHTRWSTHGPPTDANAHPHTDCTGDVAVVHNGIVENYDELKSELEAAGHAFTSETDTEVVPHLIETALADGKSPKAAVQWAVGRLEGSFAVVVTMAGVDALFATRQDSPLVVGYGDDGAFVASDVTAFLEHTRDVTYLADGDLAILGASDGQTAGDVRIERDGEPIEPERETLEWEADAAEKGGYDHYMLKEIHEQPSALRQALSGRVDPDAGTVDLDLELPAEYVGSLEEVQFVAAGTSNYAARYAAELVEELADVRATVEIASEYEFDGGRDPWRTLVVAVTQSGETADTLAAIRKASRAGARTMAVTNTLGSTVTREVDDSLFIRAGPEIGVAATKTFCSQVATMTMLSVALGRQRGTLSSDRASEVLSDLRGLPGAVQQVLDRTDDVEEVALELADSDAFFFVGRWLGHPVALEGALKLKEISYDHAEGFAAGELKHGPLALVTPETPVLAVLTEGSRPEQTLNNVKEAQAREAPVIGASSGDGAGQYLDVEWPVPDAGLLEPLITNVYWQLFAYYVADSKDRSIDKPRNLAKSVTVE
ncbi:glutamine--fructose-6-phosphate transaminase (isomerizing) [Salinarchaeum laminariae]|uniref:glutamine--fructose-6-phosphate transaminase (isomerizing) n=1 Tax=Salinarchaeum laminariae TaxID=869888 RepID=UPI0020C17246|nr:glutamine--fructose-6-phosphate transaminase (isomerizing) [Salinarchaeum laminariae]